MAPTPLEVIKNLAESRSVTRGTSLVTIYVPSNSQISLVTEKLNNELSTSMNIKSKDVRQAVQSALKSGMQLIKNYPAHCAPENGFVLCAGEISSYF
jgi:peptide chain release factor subunit 1